MFDQSIFLFFFRFFTSRWMNFRTLLQWFSVAVNAVAVKTTLWQWFVFSCKQPLVLWRQLSIKHLMRGVYSVKLLRSDSEIKRISSCCSRIITLPKLSYSLERCIKESIPYTIKCGVTMKPMASWEGRSLMFLYIAVPRAAILSLDTHDRPSGCRHT